MICEVCGKEFSLKNKIRNCTWCSSKCYSKIYYQNHRDKLLDRHKAWNKAHYVYRRGKPKTEQEKKEYRRKYYQEHKNYFLEYNRKRYRKLMLDPEFKERNRKRVYEWYHRTKAKKEKSGI